MLSDRLARAFRRDDPATTLVLAAILVALAISLGTIWGARLLGVDPGAALPAALGGAGAAIFAARSRTP
jgi:hypothetical protein